MSDIQSQARRDAEFDRLLATTRFDGGETANFYLGSAMAKAYEMGKRHGFDEGRSSLLREIERERHIAMEGH